MEWLIKSPRDSPLARAARMEAVSPQRRLFAARGIGEKSPTPDFLGGCAIINEKIKMKNFRR